MRDKVKCSTISNKLQNGGLNVPDIDLFLQSLKAWIMRFENLKGKWRDILDMYLNRSGLNRPYIWKTSLKLQNPSP